MDAGIAAVLGAATGVVGALAAAYLQARSARAARRDEDKTNLTKERLREYVHLLTVAREVRYVALRTFQHLAARSVDEVDVLLTQMSSAYYMIALTSPADTAQLAWQLREDAFDVWRLARDQPDCERPIREAAVLKVRDTAEAFRQHVRGELGIAQSELAEPADEI